MPLVIECPQCRQQLSVPDHATGKLVKCSACGNTFRAEQSALQDAFAVTKDLPSARTPNSGRSNTDDGDRRRDDDFDDVDDYPRRRRGRYDEEDDLELDADERVSRPRILRRSFDVSEVISTSWGIFKSRMGLVIGVGLVGGILIGLATVPRIITEKIANGFARQGNHETALVLHLAGLGLNFMEFILSSFLIAGHVKLLLQLARGRRAEFGDLFGGTRYLLRSVGSSLLLTLMVLAGLIACIIPGIIIGLMFMMYVHALVDQDLPKVDCLWESSRITTGNKANLFLLILTAIGINLLGALACCVGLIFTAPWTSVMFAVAYLRMTGQNVMRVD